MQAFLETQMDQPTARKVMSKTGAQQIYRVKSGEDALDLAVKAFACAINSGLNVERWSNLIFVTENSRYSFPGNGFLFSARTGLNRQMFIVDMNSGCTGFVDALKLASSIGGITGIVCSETYSKNIKTFNRAVSPIFSDGCAIVEFDSELWDFSLLFYDSHAAKYESISCPREGQLNMDGSIVFEYVRAVAIPEVKRLIETHKCGHLFVHQGSALVVDAFQKCFQHSDVAFYRNIEARGNLVSATIPHLMFDAFGNNFCLPNNEKALLASFGVGLSCSIGMLKERQ